MKHRIHFIIMGLSALLFVCFALSACGEGQVESLSGDESAVARSIHGNEGIVKCFTDEEFMATNKALCDDIKAMELPSSGSGGEDPPDSTDPSSSSTTNPGGSSDSSDPEPSSSSSAPPAEAASECQQNLQADYGLICTWTPENPISGDESSWSLTYTPPDGATGGCSEKVYLTRSSWAGANYPYTYTLINPVTVAGTLDMELNSQGYQETYEFNWPLIGNVGDGTEIRALVSCYNANEALFSCQEINCSNKLTIKEAPAPTTSGTLSFSNVSYSSASSNYYYIGTLPTYSGEITVTNNGEALCGDVGYRIMLGGSCSGTGSNLVCSGGTEITTAGAVTTGASNTTIRVEAYATCRGTDRILATAVAAVVPNPSLSGSCVWDTKNDTFGGGVSAKVTAAPTISNQYGRTCSGPYFTVGGTQKENVSLGLTVDTWSGASTQTMTNIAINANCTGYNDNITAISCPNIAVKDPDAMCEYTPDICGNVQLANVRTSYTASNGTFCVYTNNINNIKQIWNQPTVVNGTNVTSGCSSTQAWMSECVQVLANIETIDGGYYIYIDSYQSNDITGTALNSNCQD